MSLIPRSSTSPAEFPIGHDENGVLNTVTAILFYYPQPDEPYPTEGNCYYIFGKLAAIQPSMQLPEDIERALVDFQIDVFALSKLEGKQRPIAPFISVTGTASSSGNKEHVFNLDMLHYFRTGEIPSSYAFTFPINSKKYHGNNLPMPQNGSLCHVTGIITGSTFKDNNSNLRIQSDVVDISFPGLKCKSIGGSPIKGRQTSSAHWLTDNAPNEPGTPSSSQKKRRSSTPVDLTKEDSVLIANDGDNSNKRKKRRSDKAPEEGNMADIGKEK
ncbi:hypothetical protein M422DRAFT_242238 [Sphaerobolus stellatus SS14]|nr:hypothetical protein M422DRAFT_242238 [Sphaerobolus stellatus SS14]